MMNKNSVLNRWLWKWHLIGGLISIPFILLLSITGILYLFKQPFNDQIYQPIRFVSPPAAQTQPRSLQQQLDSARQHHSAAITAMKPAQTPDQASAFTLGKGRATKTLYLNPYTLESTGIIDRKETLMYSIRKLHGELLLNTPGTLFIELVASWFIVLILTGLYLWWPDKNSKMAGVFVIRTNKGRRLFWRDMHSVLSFWLSLFMLIIVAGGMPWTEVFGSQLKWVQSQTYSGYPQHWRNSRGLTSALPANQHSLSPISLDQVQTIAKQHQLKGSLTIKLPGKHHGVYSVSNQTFWLTDQQVLHLNQYSGQVEHHLVWKDVGILMELRQIFMRLHQGEYGLLNWWILLLISLTFVLTTVAGFMAYWLRRPKGQWGLPSVPQRFRVDKWLVASILIMGTVFPLFGISLLCIFMFSASSALLKKYRH